MDAMLAAEPYLDGTELEILCGLLVVKNGHLIAEGYFNEGAVSRRNVLQSVTKVGRPRFDGHLDSVDGNTRSR